MYSVMLLISDTVQKHMKYVCTLLQQKGSIFVDSFRLFIWGQLLYIYIMIQNVMAGGRVLNNLILHNKFLFRCILQSKKKKKMLYV
jgi:hypothetical protein